jgi:hypothetical protein
MHRTICVSATGICWFGGNIIDSGTGTRTSDSAKYNETYLLTALHPGWTMYHGLHFINTYFSRISTYSDIIHIHPRLIYLAAILSDPFNTFVSFRQTPKLLTWLYLTFECINNKIPLPTTTQSPVPGWCPPQRLTSPARLSLSPSPSPPASPSPSIKLAAVCLVPQTRAALSRDLAISRIPSLH